MALTNESTVIWTEYQRLKHWIMDCHETFMRSHELMILHYDKKQLNKFNEDVLQAKRQLNKLYNLCLPAGIIVNKDSTEALFIKDLIKKDKPTIGDFDTASDHLTKWFTDSGFYNLLMNNQYYEEEDVI